MLKFITRKNLTMTITEFITECSLADSSISDLANDILEDKNFSSSKSEIEIIDYIDFQTRQKGTNDVFQKFLAEFRRKNNATLKFVLNYLEENQIRSIADATENHIAMSYVETCGYLITVPFGNEYPTTIMHDLNELKTMNRQWVETSDGKDVESFLFDKPHLGDGMTLRFCCQEVQFNFLLALVNH